MELTKIALSTVFFIIMLGLSTQHKHLMLALMCIEAMMLTLFMMLIIYTMTTLAVSHTPMPIILLTISVCGASVGLSLVVATTRTHGSDFLKNLNLL
uniref:NADH-ubiquinone oxidoreductase chain 4L n=1 Tax=Xenopeltis unicolor TaxID=196253 RepID=Q402J5_XENUN|nr:NADH dehydrogenase subunit 4L [Xenopeltis unicolor]BAE20048.1 NADH dehydrogenase subunit 4L [Xenopeltis unicolor]